jgi:hypothetical protein
LDWARTGRRTNPSSTLQRFARFLISAFIGRVTQ